MTPKSSEVSHPSNGISGKLFLVLEFGLLAILFAGGLIFVAPNAAVVVNTVTNLLGYVGELAAKLVLFVIVGGVQSWLLFHHVLDTPITMLRGRFEKSRNDSHSWLLLGIFATVAIALVFAGGQTFDVYLYQLMTRAAVGYALATLAVVLVAIVFGARSMDDFRDWIDTEDNDSYAMLVAGTMILVMFLAMSV